MMVADGIVAYSADGSYEVTIKTKATVYYNGLVVWQPPAVYKSSCAIDVEFFPYDVQTCVLKLGSWTYDGFKVTIKNFLNGKTKFQKKIIMESIQPRPTPQPQSPVCSLTVLVTKNESIYLFRTVLRRVQYQRFLLDFCFNSKKRFKKKFSKFL